MDGVKEVQMQTERCMEGWIELRVIGWGVCEEQEEFGGSCDEGHECQMLLVSSSSKQTKKLLNQSLIFFPNN